MSSPIVSVVIPVYNRSQALRPTVESVLAQTFQDWELLIVDDGSTDDTPEVIAQFQDSRVRAIRRENGGGASARNRGMQAAQGQYLAFLDHDDRWAPEKLQWQVELLASQPECALAYGRISATNEAGDDLGEVRLPAHQGWVHRQLLCDRNFLFTMSNPLIRTDLVRDLGGFDPSSDISDDWDLFLRLSCVAPFGYVDRILVHYNFGNPQQQTRDAFRVYRSERALLQRHLSRSTSLGRHQRRLIWSRFRRQYAEALREQGWRALRERQVRRAQACYLEAGSLDPRSLASRAVMLDLAALILHLLGVRKLTSSVTSGNHHG